MTHAEDEPTPPDDVPEELIAQLDSLDASELKGVQSYVEDRLASGQPSIEEEIAEAETGGEILEIENHGAYALVRKHPPDPEGPGVNTDVVSLYHVRHEKRPGGEENLNWTYVGDVGSSAKTRCETCGRILGENATDCPACDDHDNENSPTEE